MMELKEALKKAIVNNFNSYVSKQTLQEEAYYNIISPWLTHWEDKHYGYYYYEDVVDEVKKAEKELVKFVKEVAEKYGLEFVELWDRVKKNVCRALKELFYHFLLEDGLEDVINYTIVEYDKKLSFCIAIHKDVTEILLGADLNEVAEYFVKDNEEEIKYADEFKGFFEKSEEEKEKAIDSFFGDPLIVTKLALAYIESSEKAGRFMRTLDIMFGKIPEFLTDGEAKRIVNMTAEEMKLEKEFYSFEEWLDLRYSIKNLDELACKEVSHFYRTYKKQVEIARTIRDKNLMEYVNKLEELYNTLKVHFDRNDYDVLTDVLEVGVLLKKKAEM